MLAKDLGWGTLVGDGRKEAVNMIKEESLLELMREDCWQRE